MDCVGINSANIYLWISLAGILLGGGFSFLLCPKRRRRPAIGAVLLSLAILSALTALIVSGFSTGDFILKLIWLGGSGALGYLSLLFWKAVGIPLLFLFVIFLSGTWYSFYGWSCAAAGAEICNFRMISEGDDFVRIQYEDSQGRTIIDKVEGDAVYPEIDAITIPDYFFILNKSRIYRFYGFGEEGTSGGGRPVFSDQIMNQIMKLPGFTSGDAQGFPLRVSPSIEYLLLFDEDGGYQLIRKL